MKQVKRIGFFHSMLIMHLYVYVMEYPLSKAMQVSGLLKAIDDLYPRPEFWVAFLISRLIFISIIGGTGVLLWEVAEKNNILSIGRINIAKWQAIFIIIMMTLFWAIPGVEIMIRYYTNTSFPSLFPF